jgi:4-alpha-glucanotransferase
MPPTRTSLFRRSSGVLLHPTSLPGPYGIGDLGPEAYRWVDALSLARQGWWQVLPLGPTGYGDSPYQCFSAFAGNVNLISPDLLCHEGLISKPDRVLESKDADPVDFQAGGALKRRLLAEAWTVIKDGSDRRWRHSLEAFREQEKAWLDDFSLFVALKDAHGGGRWQDWEPELVRRKPSALERARQQWAEERERIELGQFLFFLQWNELKMYAARYGVRIIGDLPIFISSDSADVWANQELFQLDANGLPRVVAGVPPDYFSETGQLWGNPLYDWEALKQSGYDWWVRRLAATLRLVDVVRLDHFRGFEAYWEVPGDRTTAEIGRWVPGPGSDLFEALLRGLGDLPVIAEDLGVITPEVDRLRQQYNLPGMRILQFAFGGMVEPRFLPHRYEPNTIVYTGTHDNDTTVGWYQNLSENELKALRSYVPEVGKDVAWALVRTAWASVADLAVAPAQDLLGLGSESRMNRPGVALGNWGWRLRTGQLTDSVLERLADLTTTYERTAPR